MPKMIRVLVVDDSIIASKTIMEGLAKSTRIEIAGYEIGRAHV